MLANSAIPLFVVLTYWGLWLIPAVVIFETWLATRTLGLTWRKALGPILLANLGSTLAGAFALFLLAAPTLLKSGLPGGLNWLFWAAPGHYQAWNIAGLTLMLGVACWLSIQIEGRMLASFFKALPAGATLRFARWAHYPVYAFWYGAAVVMTLTAKSPF